MALSHSIELEMDSDTGTIGFGEAISSFFENAFSFQGRATRAEFIYPHIALLLFSILVGLIAAAASTLESTVILSFICLIIAFIIPSITLTTRRLHDVNISGWWQLLYVVPLIGSLVFPVLCILKGSKNRNAFG
jgi:uncharacterized membrane protein YhaH (DUF805 family)